MMQVGGGYFLAPAPEAPHGPRDRAIGRSPAEDEQLGALLAVDDEIRDVGRDAGDLLGAELGHPRVVVWLVADVAGDVLLLEAADHVLQALGARQGPWPCATLVPQVRQELPVRVRARCEAGIDLGEIGGVRKAPRLR